MGWVQVLCHEFILFIQSSYNCKFKDLNTWFSESIIDCCLFWRLFAPRSPTSGRSLPFFFTSTASRCCLYSTLLCKQCFLLRVVLRTGQTRFISWHWSSFFSLSFLFFVLLQVKVWFQNRRTKFKRQKLEEEGSESQQKKKGSHHINRWRLATKQASPEEIDVTSDD